MTKEQKAAKLIKRYAGIIRYALGNEGFSCHEALMALTGIMTYVAEDIFAQSGGKGREKFISMLPEIYKEYANAISEDASEGGEQ